jgi:hypothetical protein
VDVAGILTNVAGILTVDLHAWPMLQAFGGCLFAEHGRCYLSGCTEHLVELTLQSTSPSQRGGGASRIPEIAQTNFFVRKSRGFGKR